MTTLLPHEDTNLFQVKAGADMVFDATLVATDDLRYLPPQLELFASRHDPAANTMLLEIYKGVSKKVGVFGQCLASVRKSLNPNLFCQIYNLSPT